MNFTFNTFDQNTVHKSVKHPEHDMQVACVEWFNLQYPKYRGLLFAVPNGAHLSGNMVQRRLAGMRLRQEGMVSGVADLLLLVPAWGYHGACLEMKAINGVQQRSQKLWADKVKAQGYMYRIIKPTKEKTGLEVFISEINSYMKGIEPCK